MSIHWGYQLYDFDDADLRTASPGGKGLSINAGHRFAESQVHLEAFAKFLKFEDEFIYNEKVFNFLLKDTMIGLGIRHTAWKEPLTFKLGLAWHKLFARINDQEESFQSDEQIVKDIFPIITGTSVGIYAGLGFYLPFTEFAGFTTDTSFYRSKEATLFEIEMGIRYYFHFLN